MSSRPPVVLIIDDDAGLRYASRRDLESGGCIVLEAENGYRALTTMGTLIPDVVVLDLQMPVLDGWETLRFLRNDDRLRNVPIIVATSDTWEDRALPEGVTCCLAKPVSREVLLRVVLSARPGVPAQRS